MLLNFKDCYLYMIILFIFIFIFIKFDHPTYYNDDPNNEFTNTYNENIYSILKDNSSINLSITVPRPNIIFQTYHNKNKIPQYVYDTMSKYAPNYQHIILDDTEAIIFLNTYFQIEVVDTFRYLKNGAHKADLLRYCLLYIYGGIYLDIKVLLLTDIDNIFMDKTLFYSCLGSSTTHIHQAILASPPHNILFLSLIKFCVLHKADATNYYYIFIKDLYKKLLNDLNDNLNLGLNNGRLGNYYLFEELCNDKKYNNKCTKKDHYGLCCNIFDNGKQIFIGRDSEYPY